MRQSVRRRHPHGPLHPGRALSTIRVLVRCAARAERHLPPGRLRGRRRRLGGTTLLAQADRLRAVLRDHPGDVVVVHDVYPARPAMGLGRARVVLLRLCARGRPDLDADVARCRLPLQRGHRVRRRRLLGDGHAGGDRRRADRGHRGAVVQSARRTSQPRTRDPARSRSHAREPGRRRADDRRGRQHVRCRRRPQGAARVHPARRPGAPCAGHPPAGLGLDRAATQPDRQHGARSGTDW